MARPKPWLKMWIEWLHDPKMLGLTLAEAGAWWKLLTLAQQCKADGQLVKDNGSPLSLPEIANSLHISTPRDMKTLQSMIEKMEAADSLIWSSHVLTIVHFAERQAKTSPSKVQKTTKIGVSAARDPSTIKTINELFKACFDDFNMQPDQVIQELGYSSQSDISELPSECYSKILFM
ncbi:unnamed protein product [marine sediment metagenome]|uniref:Phage replisome organiser N-terminal domain-containing protein n=1 Tax=marine sediment metagenome TaxID=412755 RepID=X1V907_9ZZZZ